MTTIFIDGAVGTTGLQIGERLAGRSEFVQLTLPEEKRKDAIARRDALNAADIVILCLPDDAAREAVALIDNPHTRVIDASTAHRIAPGWIYGFPEVSGRAAVAEAMRVSNPGCYSTGFIALVAPLVKAGLIPADWPLTCNAVSGYSGGGKSMIAEFESGEGVPPAWRTYGLRLNHKHVPEMRERCGLAIAPLFAPAVANLFSGMIVEVPLHLAALPSAPTAAALSDALAAAYEESPIVRVVSGYDEGTLAIERLADTDRLDLFVFADVANQQARLAAALDNLGKGAAGAAVQSLNLMAGLPETAGLRL
ncbi:N-acetyl-gamma-glutamyl-phosphate reductase [Sphingomonas sp. MMS24-J13]|uniref:N-acetyl-gamma-glutamyl-phosphate reductase n=1 Tax=Sphingomonas sp. MMS24-J13 TaxID=3238686 RepID=UPI00384A889C